jgi:hypothetical protein
MKEIICPFTKKRIKVYPLKDTPTKAYAEYPDKVKNCKFNDDHDLLIVGDSVVTNVEFIGANLVNATTLTDCKIVDSKIDDALTIKDSTIINSEIGSLCNISFSTVLRSKIDLTFLYKTIVTQSKLSTGTHKGSILIEVSGNGFTHQATLNSMALDSQTYIGTYYKKQTAYR